MQGIVESTAPGSPKKSFSPFGSSTCSKRPKGSKITDKGGTQMPLMSTSDSGRESKWVQLLSNNVAEVLPTARNVMGFGVHRRLANTGCRFSSPRKDAVERSMRNVYELRLHTYPIFAHFGRISGRNSLK
jgi:hypothetical protein